MAKPRVLISDKLSAAAVEIFKNNGVDADVKVGLKPEELLAIIGDYDGLAIRSATKVTPEVIKAGKRLKVIGRAGIGVDNVDREAATAAGVIVMNTPFGNSVTTAEHSIALMMSLARKIPQASESTHKGKWEKNKFEGVELMNKTLGLIGCGNIGGIVADRAQGLKMKVVAFDPFLTAEKAKDMNVEKVATLDELLKRADFISLHTPLNAETKNILNKDSLAKCKKGVRIINCARGGLVNEADLKAALESGQVAGAAFDVFEEEPATTNILFGLEGMVCTPHLGASTSEAQENVALQVAEQMSDYLVNGTITNALNMPSVSAEEAAKLKPYLALAEVLGKFAGQMAKEIKSIKIEYSGNAAKLNTKAITSVVLKGTLENIAEGVNMVNAPAVAKERKIEVSEVKNEDTKDYSNLIRITVDGASVAGSVLGKGKPRLVEINEFPLEAAIGKTLLYVKNEDKPGLIGNVGTILGNNKINIANFHLGRSDSGAVALIEIDGDLSDKVLAEIAKVPTVLLAKVFRF